MGGHLTPLILGKSMGGHLNPPPSPSLDVRGLNKKIRDERD